MSLFDVIPENMFSLLSSKNKLLYSKALFILLDSFKTHLQISKNELANRLCAELEEDIETADYSEDELLENEKTFRGKANFLIRKMDSAGWIEIETDTDFEQYVTIPPFSFKIIQLLYEITNSSETENFAYVYSTSSSLKAADESHNTYEMVTALNDSYERTQRLVESLKSVYHGITYYNQKLISDIDVNSVLSSHFMQYREEIVARVLYPLKVKDSVPKYRNSIIGILKSWSIEDEMLDKMAEYQFQNGKAESPEICRDEMLRKIHEIIDIYDSLEQDFILPVDNKNRKYTRATTQKINYLVNSDQTVVGNLALILRKIREEGENGSALEMLSGEFELYEQSDLNENSLFIRKQGVKHAVSEEQDMTDDTEEVRKTAVKNIKDLLNNKFSKQKINDFVLNLLDGKDEITTEEIMLSDDDAYVFTILSVAQSADKNSPYTLETKEGSVHHGKYELPLIIYRRKNNGSEMV